MKRLLLVIIGVFLLLTFGVGLFVAHRQRQSYRVMIPEQAVSVVNIRVDGLIADILWNKLWNRSYYSRTDKKRDEVDGMLPFRAGIAVPANLFLYQFANEPFIFFGVLPIDDMAEFQTFVHRRSEWTYEPGDTSSRLLSDHLLAIHNADRVAFAVFWEAGDKVPVMEARLQKLLRGNGQVSLRASRFEALKDSKGHLNMMGEQLIQVNFEPGAIRFARDGEPGNVVIPDKLRGGNTGFLQLPAWYWASVSSGSWRLGSYTLSKDSIMDYTRGDMQVWWTGTTRKLDTIINYEFDEDFNAITVRDTIERIIPAIYGTVSADAGRLLGYLTAQGVLDTLSAQINPTVFPLLPLYVREINGNLLQVTTVHGTEEQAPAFHYKPDNGNDAMLLYLDVAAIVRQAVLPERFNPYLAPLSTIEVQGASRRDGRWPVRGKITMRHASINSLVQLLTE